MLIYFCMSIHIILGKLTQKVIEHMKCFTERDSRRGKIIRTVGGKMLARY